MKVGIVGAGGYAGGELLRLLLTHPDVKEIVAGSESMAGKPVHAAHPNLRKRTDMQFAHYEDVTGCDVIFLSLPNGTHRADEFDGPAVRPHQSDVFRGFSDSFRFNSHGEERAEKQNGGAPKLRMSEAFAEKPRR